MTSCGNGGDPTAVSMCERQKCRHLEAGIPSGGTREPPQAWRLVPGTLNRVRFHLLVDPPNISSLTEYKQAIEAEMGTPAIVESSGCRTQGRTTACGCVADLITPLGGLSTPRKHVNHRASGHVIEHLATGHTSLDFGSRGWT